MYVSRNVVARFCNYCCCGNTTVLCVNIVGLRVAVNNKNLLSDARNVLMANLRVKCRVTWALW
jgi:hypothetical protein